jgi:hypothetical protein
LEAAVTPPVEPNNVATIQPSMQAIDVTASVAMTGRVVIGRVNIGRIVIERMRAFLPRRC